MVTTACENIEKGIDLNVVDSSPSNWLELQNNFDLNTKGVYNNNEPTATFFA